jgi:GGDEF domain-containing protein
LISIRKLGEALDRDAMLREMAASYSLAIQSIADYALELDAGELARFKVHLGLIERQWREHTSVEAAHAIQASLRGELREYRDQSRLRLSLLRQQMEDTAKALTEFIAGVELSGSENEKTLADQVQRLQAAAGSDDLAQVRAAIGEAVTGITVSVAQIRNANRLVILQLQDEINTLHREFRAERTMLFTDVQSGAGNRQKIEGRIDELIRQGQFFCVLFLAVGNLKSVEHGNSQAIVDGALQALVRRFQGAVGAESLIGRWNTDTFAAVMDVPASAAIAVSSEVMKAVSGRFAVQSGGSSNDVRFQVTTAVMERGEAIDAQAFHKKLDQWAAALREL